MPARLANTSALRRSSSLNEGEESASTPKMRPSGAWTGTASREEEAYHSQVSCACAGGSVSFRRSRSAAAPGHSSMPPISSGMRVSIAASVMPARSGSYGRLSTAPSASRTAREENHAAAGRM